MADEALLACPLLTSCCAAWLLTGHRPVLVCGLGVGDPWVKLSGFDLIVPRDIKKCLLSSHIWASNMKGRMDPRRL